MKRTASFEDHQTIKKQKISESNCIQGTKNTKIGFILNILKQIKILQMEGFSFEQSCQHIHKYNTCKNWKKIVQEGEKYQFDFESHLNESIQHLTKYNRCFKQAIEMCQKQNDFSLEKCNENIQEAFSPQEQQKFKYDIRFCCLDTKSKEKIKEILQQKRKKILQNDIHKRIKKEDRNNENCKNQKKLKQDKENKLHFQDNSKYSVIKIEDESQQILKNAEQQNAKEDSLIIKQEQNLFTLENFVRDLQLKMSQKTRWTLKKQENYEKLVNDIV